MTLHTKQTPIETAWERSAMHSMDAQLLPLLFRTEQQYGWSVGMRATTHSLLSSCTLPPGAVADIGCGGGLMVEELSVTYPCRRVFGVDVSAHALASAAMKHFGAAFAQADLSTLPFPDGNLALMLALDVYDQQGVDLASALAESMRVLCPGGVLLLRVSAKPWLKGPHDAAFNTGTRYESNDIRLALNDAGFVPERLTFANTLLSLPQGALRMLQRWRLLPLLPSLYTARAVNTPLAVALSLEARWLRTHNLPGGLSLYAIARKPNHRDISPDSTRGEARPA